MERRESALLIVRAVLNIFKFRPLIASSDNRDTVANSARAPLDDKSKKELSSKLRTLKKASPFIL
jgi:hypothetical protein